jgi:N-acetylglucosaminyl-diphospho-decaprenol L-rhamnosyltransferase
VSPKPASTSPVLGESGASQERLDCEIVVISYNSAQYIDDLLDSLPAATRWLRTRCTVVDNNSQDGTQSKVRARTDVRLIEAGRNLGYSGAINIGRAAAGPCSSLLITNPDLIFEPDAITNLYRALKAERSGVSVPMMCQLDGSLYFSLRREANLLTALGDALFGERWPTRPGWLSDIVRDKRIYEYPHDVDWASGAAMLISEQCNEAVGDWDSARFFLYAEETDFAARARRLGFRLRYVPEARVRHESGGSGRSPALYTLMHVNRMRYFEKYHSRLSSVIFRGITILHHLLRVRDPDMRATLRVVLRRSSWTALPHGDPSDNDLVASR